MNFYVNRTRDKHPYVTGPFISFAAADAFAIRWLDPDEGSYSVTTHDKLVQRSFDFNKLVDPYHSAQIEAQKHHSSTVLSGVRHINEGAFDDWMALNAG